MVHMSRILNQPVDVSAEFRTGRNDFFLPIKAEQYDASRGTGLLRWEKHRLETGVDFAHAGRTLGRNPAHSFRGDLYGDELCPFSVSFVTPRTIRIRLATARAMRRAEPSLMLAGRVPADRSWKASRQAGGVVHRSAAATVAVETDPWRIRVSDASGRELTRTLHVADTACFLNYDPMPFCFVRRQGDMRRSIAASFSLQHDEKIFGCGESFTRLDKRGQRVVLWASDAQGVQNDRMYKPIPFFMSSHGYGMFVHGTTPMAFDFGKTYDASTVLFTGDDELDLFIFAGTPKEILSEYTRLTGRSPVPPVWSFGLWMSRISYFSQKEAMNAARGLRRHRIPCDVIHLDTGWFEKDWQCDYRFAPKRFPNPRRMIRDLGKQGIRVCLWQLPYFTRDNALYREIMDKGLAVRDEEGGDEVQEAVLDFSNPKTVAWYQGKLASLLRMGVAAIKVDFGEGGPLEGRYASGRSGWHEHNHYPLRYNRAAAAVTKRVRGNGFIWARSAWAGSQRYPMHWGGDAENTNSAMAATLRAGLSFGLSGFSYWSHDIGGFVKRTPEGLYRRWMPFGMLTSHSRCHGAPPKEPWPYGPAFTDLFRRCVELKYSLMPYILAQAKESSANGWPMLRALFFEFPEDPGSWLIDDEYLFGRDLLVGPLFDESGSRRMYLPPGRWIDYQTRRGYDGPGWHTIAVGAIPAVILARHGAVIPHVAPVLSTDFLDWNTVRPVAF